MGYRDTQLAFYAAKIEATEGTDAVPGPTTDAIQLLDNLDPVYEPTFKNPRENTVKGPVLDPSKPLPPTGKVYSWTKRAWWRGTTGAPTALNPHELDAWLQSMGLAVTYDATGGAEKASYTPASTSLKTITEYLFHDGKRRIGVAGRSEGSFTFDVGGPLIVECATQGILSAEADVAVPTNGVYKATVPPIATDMSVASVDGFSAGIVRKFELKLGNTIERRGGVKAVGGVAGFRIGRRKATWSMVLEEPLIAVKDFRALQTSAADVALAWTLGATQYNMADFSAAGAVVESVVPGNDNGLAIVTISGGLYGGTPFTLALK